MKNKVDKLDVDKLVPFIIDLSKLSDVVKTDIVKKGAYHCIKKVSIFAVNLVSIFPHSHEVYLRIQSECGKIRTRLNPNTDTFHAVHNAKIKKIEDKIFDITNLASNASLNGKINEVKREIPSITNLVTTSALNAKINEVEVKYLILLT